MITIKKNGKVNSTKNYKVVHAFAYLEQYKEEIARKTSICKY